MAGTRARAIVKLIGLKNACIFCALLHVGHSQRKKLISAADKDLIHCIAECSLNVLNGNVKLTDSEKNKLKKHKKTLRKLARNNGGLKSKKKAVQKGGAAFLPALLAPIVGGLISHFLTGNSE